MLLHAKQMISKAIDNQVPGLQLASFYTKAMLDDHIYEMNKKNRKITAYSVTISGLPAFTGTPTTKSLGEKRYEAWTRRRSDKRTLLM